MGELVMKCLNYRMHVLCLLKLNIHVQHNFETLYMFTIYVLHILIVLGDLLKKKKKKNFKVLSNSTILMFWFLI